MLCLKCGAPVGDAFNPLCPTCTDAARRSARLAEDFERGGPPGSAFFRSAVALGSNRAEIAADYGWRLAREANDRERCEVFEVCHKAGRLADASDFIVRRMTLAEIKAELAVGETWATALTGAQHRWQ